MCTGLHEQLVWVRIVPASQTLVFITRLKSQSNLEKSWWAPKAIEAMGPNMKQWEKYGPKEGYEGVCCLHFVEML